MWLENKIKKIRETSDFSNWLEHIFINFIFGGFYKNVIVQNLNINENQKK